MEKKKYSKPVVVAERFEPQEYCTTCAVSGREYRPNGYRYYFDFIDDGICQASVESVDRDGKTSCPDGRYTIETYQLQSKKLGDWSVALAGDPNERRYGTDNQWSSWGIEYRVRERGSVSVVVKDGQVYRHQS